MVLREDRKRNQRPLYKKKYFWQFCFEFSRELWLIGKKFCSLRWEKKKVCFMLKGRRCSLERGRWQGKGGERDDLDLPGWVGGDLMLLSLHGGNAPHRVQGTANRSPQGSGEHEKGLGTRVCFKATPAVTREVHTGLAVHLQGFTSFPLCPACSWNEVFNTLALRNTHLNRRRGWRL